MSNDQLILDLDFVMTHPKVEIKNLEWFYNNCLMAYHHVPVFKIVNYMNMSNPSLLRDWSSQNVAIRNAMQELEILETSVMTIALRREDLLYKNGFYITPYHSPSDSNSLYILKNRKHIDITCEGLQKLTLAGIQEESARHFILYLKPSEASK
ncbi:hypothetical protein [Paenibacillus peoriae]|uniref:hypothetical protein n=1 Tax=Paenibacillus peoriae TaxID=59893 RepID=UPI00215AD880|nr:hypothetical protein [Paenibacillus peoriae]